jgi:predicted nucleotidyltransferase/DNA-binding XRE family transcriptional regulator
LKTANLNNTDVARILKVMRLKKGLTQKELGQKLGLSRSSISRIERGLRNLNESQISDYLRKGDLKKKDYYAYVNAVLAIKKQSSNAYNESATVRELENPSNNSRSVLIALLKKYFENKPIKEAFLFGSTARNEHSAKSDIDLYLSFSKEHPVTIFDLGKMQVEINQLTGKRIDLVLAGSEYDFLKNSLNKDKILIYG